MASDPPLAPNGAKEARVDTSTVKHIAFVSLVFYLLAVAISFMLDAEIGKAAAVGGAISVGSFWLTAIVMGPVFKKKRMGAWTGAIYWLKYTLLIGSVGVLILHFEMNAVGLVIGYSVILPSVIFEAVIKSSAIREDMPQ